MAFLRSGGLARAIRNALLLGLTVDRLALITRISTGTDYPREEASIADPYGPRHTTPAGDDDEDSRASKTERRS
jgi:hypothetical protein